MRYPCIKRQVYAVVAKGLRTWTGGNWCSRKVKKCPRSGMPTGKGWDLCKKVCAQEYHAEMDALRLAGKNAKGAVMYLIGHTYICDECRRAAKKAGIKDMFVVTIGG